MNSPINDFKDISEIHAQLMSRHRTVDKAVKQPSFMGRILNYLNPSRVPTLTDETKIEYVQLVDAFHEAILSKESAGIVVPENFKKDLAKFKATRTHVSKQIPFEVYREVIYSNKSAIDSTNNLLSPASLTSPTTTPSTAPQSVNSHEREWHLNLGLLMNVYKRTQDPQLKKQIGFLVANYLAKVAPIDLKAIGGTPDQNSQHQVGFFQRLGYHREDSAFEEMINKKINYPSALGFEKLYITENTHYTDALDSQFAVLSTPSPQPDGSVDWAAIRNQWKDKIKSQIESHFSKYSTNFDGFNAKLSPPLLVDLTNLMDAHLRACLDKADPNDPDIFRLLTALRQEFDAVCNEVANDIQQTHPAILANVNPGGLQRYIKDQLVGISRTEYKEVGLLKEVPIFYPSFNDAKANAEVLDHRRKVIREFVEHGAIRLGAISAREKIHNFMNLEEFVAQSSIVGSKALLASYKPIGANIQYYKDKSEITASPTFQRFASRAANPALMAKYPYLSSLGKPTSQLISGLMQEITEEKWNELNNNPDTRELIQTSLSRMMIHLGKAENMMDKDFKAFAEAIELVHAEISTILSIAKPLNPAEFEGIYKSQLKVIPADLREHVKVGIAKTAMNIFSGVSAAVKKQKPDAVLSYAAETSYYEEVAYLGEKGKLQDVLSDTAINSIDLYVGEFNHNISVNANHTHYVPGNLIQDVENIMQKNKGQPVTVAIDCTIALVNSGKINELLTRFSQEIKDGQLNFVMFRSGQKFDMLGMDNYYGAPYYVINNGDKKWEAFNQLPENKSYKTDPLSEQWFCLANKYAPQAREEYTKTIFQNTKEILDHVPDSLKPGGQYSKYFRISTVESGTIKDGESIDGMDACFIDIKATNPTLLQTAIDGLIKKFADKDQKLYARASFGFFHANFITIAAAGSNIRINPGLDKKDVVLITEFLEELAKAAKGMEDAVQVQQAAIAAQNAALEASIGAYIETDVNKIYQKLATAPDQSWALYRDPNTKLCHIYLRENANSIGPIQYASPLLTDLTAVIYTNRHLFSASKFLKSEGAIQQGLSAQDLFGQIGYRPIDFYVYNKRDDIANTIGHYPVGGWTIERNAQTNEYIIHRKISEDLQGNSQIELKGPFSNPENLLGYLANNPAECDPDLLTLPPDAAHQFNISPNTFRGIMAQYVQSIQP